MPATEAGYPVHRGATPSQCYYTRKGGYSKPVLLYPKGGLFQASIIIPERGAIPSQYYPFAGGYSKPVLYYPFAGGLLQASIILPVKGGLLQASIELPIWRVATSSLF